eukprot:3794256-Amphidinium_carterae.1
MPLPTGPPKQYGDPDDLTERSRSARRQKDRSPSQTKGSEQRRDHDFSEDIDYTGEDPIIEEDDWKVEQYDAELDDDVKFEYADRTDEFEIVVDVDFNCIQNKNPKPRLVDKPPPWYHLLNRYIPVGGIKKLDIVNHK